MRRTERLTGSIMLGDCAALMGWLDPASIDFVLTDPPYITNYRTRDGRSVLNDDNDRWLAPAFRQIFRVLKEDSFCVSFYGWNHADRFIAAWRAAARLAGHIVFPKSYASSTRYMHYRHEQAYLLAKGDPSRFGEPIADTIPFPYSGNRLHPTQKPIEALEPLIGAFCPTGGIVLDPFCGSGVDPMAARNCGRRFLGIELAPEHYRTAFERLRTASHLRQAA